MQSFSRLKLKVCGMRNPDNIRQVAALHPDYMGFIFYSGSKRMVDEKFVIPGDLSAAIKRVGVFVDSGYGELVTTAKKHKLDLLQLHGDESAAECKILKAADIKVIKVFSIGDDFDFDQVIPFKEHVEYFMFDTMGVARGGTGRTFDWAILEKYDQEIPFFLSGGLTPENVQEVRKLKKMNIHAIDVNSGVEISPGMKDIQLIEKVKNVLLRNHWLEY